MVLACTDDVVGGEWRWWQLGTRGPAPAPREMHAMWYFNPNGSPSPSGSPVAVAEVVGSSATAASAAAAAAAAAAASGSDMCDSEEGDSSSGGGGGSGGAAGGSAAAAAPPAAADGGLLCLYGGRGEEAVLDDLCVLDLGNQSPSPLPLVDVAALP